MGILLAPRALLLTLSFMVMFGGGQAGLASGDLPAHKKLHQIYTRQVNTLKNLEKLIQETTESPQSSDHKKITLLRNIDSYKENKLRVSFLRRLSQQFDSYYTGQALTPFLIERLGVMATHETKSPDPNHNMVLFIMGCRDVLINKPSHDRKPLELLLKYMNYTSITKIKTSSRFYEEQDYSNGNETFEANKIGPDQIGLLVEDKIKGSVKSLQEYERELLKNAPLVPKTKKREPPETEKPMEPAKENPEKPKRAPKASLKKPKSNEPIMNEDSFKNLFKGPKKS